jgi:type VI secretion system secreted protein VgrG
LPITLAPAAPELETLVGDLVCTAATLEQAIHEGYELRVEVLAPASRSQDLLRLREQHVTVHLEGEPFLPRVAGVVHRVRALITDAEGPIRYELHVRPAAWAMSNTRRKRIFHDKTTKQIAALVLASHSGVPTPSFHGMEDRPKREYTVQYDESDWDFVRRLLADDGLALLTEIDTGKPVITADTRLETMPAVSVPFAPHAGHAAQTPFVERLTTDTRVVPKSVVVRAFDESHPLVELEGRAGMSLAAPGEPPNEVYAFEADAFRSHEAAQARAAQLLEELESEGEQIVLLTSFAAPPGCHLEVTGTPIDLPKLLVLRSTTTFGLDSAGAKPVARSTLVTAPVRRYRPKRLSKPLIRGAQTAFVRGAPGQAIDVDEAGRVEVEFRWDRRDSRRGGALRRVRIGQPWAGAAYGLSAVPRVGDEVIVSFLEGDPDHPLVVGNVQNGAAPGPLVYPSQRAHTVLRTQSTPDSEGYNELRLVDDAGAELVHMRAQRDMESVTLNDSRRFVGANDRQRIEKDQEVVVMGQQKCVVTQGGSRLSKSDDWTCNGPVDICCTVFTLQADERHDYCGVWTSRADSHTITSGSFDLEASDEVNVRAPSVTLSDGEATIMISGGRILLYAQGASLEITPGIITAIAGLIDLNP